MNILLIYPRPDADKHARFGFSYEMLTVATVLRTYHSITIKDYSCQEFDPAALSAEIGQGRFDLLLLECDSFALKRSENLKHARELISICGGRIPVIAYGNYCYITKASFDKADHTIFCNDINALLAQVNALDGAIQMPYFSNYDALPYIDRSMLLSIAYYKENRHNTLLQTAKGCENTCVFCQRKGWQDHYVPHSDEYVLGELRILREQGYKNVWIIDENFTFDLGRAKRLFSAIYERSLMTGMGFFISSWANIDNAFLDLAARCNVRIISFGIESACREILDFYKKNIRLERVPDLIRYADSVGIFTVGNFILGAPMETNESIDATFSFIESCGFDQVNIKTLDYMIGSELYDSLPGPLRGDDHVFACTENGLTCFSIRELTGRRDRFLREYYAKHKKAIAKKIREYGPPY